MKLVIAVPFTDLQNLQKAKMQCRMAVLATPEVVQIQNNSRLFPSALNCAQCFSKHLPSSSKVHLLHGTLSNAMQSCAFLLPAMRN